jgi:predicted metal-dependent phosphotriesterase family hydrolase
VIAAGAGSLDADDAGALLNAGAWLLFDGIGADPDRDLDRARRIVRLVEGGNLDRLLLSHAFRRRSHLTGYQGRPGLGYVIEQFAVMLLEVGLEALDVRRMLVDNAAAALSTVATVSKTHETHREERM